MKIPTLWSEEEVQIRKDGYLILSPALANLVPSLPEGRNQSPQMSDDAGEERKEEEQPLLLHSTELLLLELYPSMTKTAILSLIPKPLVESPSNGQDQTNSEAKMDTTQPSAEEFDKWSDEQNDELGNDLTSDMDVDKETGEMNAVIEDTSIQMPINTEADSKSQLEDGPCEDQPQNSRRKNRASKNKNKSKEPQKKAENDKQEFLVYQKLKRSTNLSNRIQSALLDIQYHRHRPVKTEYRLTREEAKLKALENQQQRLLNVAQRSKSTEAVPQSNEGENDDGDVEDANDPINETEAKEAQDEGGEQAKHFPREPRLVKLIRTINSIRALYPHLYPMLNHKRRNERSLSIGSVQWKSTKRRAFCWLLGTETFDTSTGKIVKNAHKDATFILQSFIPIGLAREISQDPMGGTQEFWTKSWISQVKARANPEIVNPMEILTRHLTENRRENQVLRRAQDCDRSLQNDSPAVQEGDIQEKYDAAVRKLHQTISKLLKNRFPKARVSIYGSCLSKLSLGKGADVDLSLWLPEAAKLQTDFQEGRIEAGKYERQMKQFVYQVYHKLNARSNEFRGMQPITRARVPVVKGTYNFANNPFSFDGSINFDICFLNDIAVANSGLLHQYSLVDPRVRSLMMTVKLWANEYKINSAKDNYISSYAWINLVIFYLQCIGFLPNLQSKDLMNAVNLVHDPDNNYWHSVNKLDTCYLNWNEVQAKGAWELPSDFATIPVSILLYGFFEFYSRRFPIATFVISIKEAQISILKFTTKKIRSFYCIEDPFETFDSHCPHDLGTPASEGNSLEIIEYLESAEKHLLAKLLGKSDTKKLWPHPPFVEPEASRNSSKAPTFKTFAAEIFPDTGSDPKNAVSSKSSPNPSFNRRAVELKKVGRGFEQKGKRGGGRGSGGNSNKAKEKASKVKNEKEVHVSVKPKERQAETQHSERKAGNTKNSRNRNRNNKHKISGRGDEGAGKTGNIPSRKSNGDTQ